MATPGAKPWYREFWLWFVLAPVIATVIGGFATLYIAGMPPALVVDDFGQIAMAVEQDQNRDRRASELRLTARLQFIPGETVTVALTGDAPGGVQLHFAHPTRADLDQHVELERIGSDWRGHAPQPQTRMYVQLTDDNATWRLTGELHPGEPVLDLHAGARR